VPQAKFRKWLACHNELTIWFAHVALQFISKGSSLLIVHVISELLEGRLHIRFSGYF
jgi:hypothetical protein